MIAVVGVLAFLVVWLGGHAGGACRRAALLERLHQPARVASLGAGLHVRSVPAWVPWVVAGAVTGWVLVAPLGAVLGAVGAILVRRLVARRRSAKRSAAEDEQLADAVGALSAALRAGRSLPQAIGYAAEETPAPLHLSIRRMVDDLAVGVPLEYALDGWATELGTGDARLLAGVLHLHRRSGGDLPMVLDQVGVTLRERRAATQEVRALTAQARLSGAILGFLPIGFFGFLWLTSRSDIEGAFRTPAGIAAVTVGLAMEGLAFLWIRHLLEVR